jgi:hypothetical protein
VAVLDELLLELDEGVAELDELLLEPDEGAVVLDELLLELGVVVLGYVLVDGLLYVEDDDELPVDGLVWYSCVRVPS